MQKKDLTKKILGFATRVVENFGAGTEYVESIMNTKEGGTMEQNYLNVSHKNCNVTMRKKIIEQARKDAELEKNKIIKAAQTERDNIIKAAQAESRRIVETAKKEAEDIRRNASLQAVKRTEDADKRILDNAEKHLQLFKDADEEIQNDFSAVKAQLVLVNDKIKAVEEMLSSTNSSITKLDQAFPDNMTKKAYTQLFYLFDMIEDTIESTQNIWQKNKGCDLENALANMKVFSDIIIEDLGDFGIKAIQTRHGESFSGKYHCLRNKNQQFDTKTVVISKSIRAGFVFGDVVLRKEIVEITEAK
ncbi:hypothetical protein J6Y50_01765 [bacterium]|nr:hypothetical protein [bacterium]